MEVFQERGRCGCQLHSGYPDLWVIGTWSGKLSNVTAVKGCRYKTHSVSVRRYSRSVRENHTDYTCHGGLVESGKENRWSCESSA